MKKLVADLERGLVDEELQAWLETKSIRFEPASGGPEKQKTQAGVIESGNRTSRRIMHRVDQAAADMNLPLSNEELGVETGECRNSTPMQGGVSPWHGARGQLPDDPLMGKEPLSGTQAHDAKARFWDRARLRHVGMWACNETFLQDRIEAVDRAKRRSPAEGTDPEVINIEEGDDCDVWRNPDHKDIAGWRGPATLVKLPDSGSATVRWGGRVFDVPRNLLRRHDAFTLFSTLYGANAIARFLEWIENVEELWGRTLLLGIVITPHGSAPAKGNEKFADLWAEAQLVADDCGLRVDGVILGNGVAYVPPLGREGASLLVYWRTGESHTMCLR